MILNMHQLPIYSLLPVIAYSAKIEREPLNRFPFPAGTILSIIIEDTEETLQKEGPFLSGPKVLL